MEINANIYIITDSQALMEKTEAMKQIAWKACFGQYNKTDWYTY